jgi:hypothetical protein
MRKVRRPASVLASGATAVRTSTLGPQAASAAAAVSEAIRTLTR